MNTSIEKILEVEEEMKILLKNLKDDLDKLKAELNQLQNSKNQKIIFLKPIHLSS